MGIFSTKKQTRWDKKVVNIMEKGDRVFTSQSEWPGYQQEDEEPTLEPKRPSPKLLRYGIDQVIELMRTLPSGDQQLVTDVVLQTLKSAEIDVLDILDSAALKIKNLDERSQTLRDKIAMLEREIKAHQNEITNLEADRAETTATKARIESRTTVPEPQSVVDISMVKSPSAG